MRKRWSLVVLGAASLVAPASAQAAVIAQESVEVPPARRVFPCAEKADYISCETYSPATVTITATATTDEGDALADGTEVQLQRYNPVSKQPEGGPVTQVLDGTSDFFSFRVKVGQGTAFIVRIFEGGTQTAQSRPLFVYPRAKVNDTSKATQKGANFVLKGSVAFASDFGGGKLTVQRCKKRARAKCRLNTSADWRPATFTKSMSKGGAFKTTLKLPGAGKWWFRVVFDAKKPRNSDEGFTFSITRTIG